MSANRKTERISTAARIAKLDIPEGQRTRALADLEKASTIVGAVFAAAKWLHLR